MLEQARKRRETRPFSLFLSCKCFDIYVMEVKFVL